MDARARRLLLEQARAAVDAVARGGSVPRAGPDRPAEVDAPGGAFVTLLGPQGELRGCIGTTGADRPLLDVVTEMAAAAAQRDPRFRPVRPEEVAGLAVEISVLHPLEPARGPQDVRVGAHGLVAEGLGRRGLLLPQVAIDRGWDAVTFCRQTCVKAGLPPDAYEDPEVALYRFEAEVIDSAAPPPTSSG